MREKPAAPNKFFNVFCQLFSIGYKLLSDNAKVDGTDEIRESVTAKNLQLQIPIFSIAFGEQADFKFLNQISEMNKGFARRVYEDNDATLQVTKSWLHFVIHCLMLPVLKDRSKEHI